MVKTEFRTHFRVPVAIMARNGPINAGHLLEYERENAEANQLGITQWPKLDEVIPWIDALGHDHRDVHSVQLMKLARTGYGFEIELLKLRKPPESGFYKVTHVVGADEMFPDMVPHR